MMFRRKPQVVTAGQLKRDHQPWPDGVCICNTEGFWALHVHTPHGPKYVPDGAWVFRDLDGSFDCMPEEDFNALYEPMP